MIDEILHVCQKRKFIIIIFLFTLVDITFQAGAGKMCGSALGFPS